VRLREIHAKYRDSVEFIVVYVKEAHPTDKWWLGRTRTQRALHEVSGDLARIDVSDPVTLAQRREVAASCHSGLLDGVVPLYVDTIDNRVNNLYTGQPTRIYFIGTDGRVVYNPGTGPFGFNPDHLGLVIEEYLAKG
jgi:hypothetical protein